MTTESTEAVLNLVKKEVLSYETYIHQTEKGTVFYRRGEMLWIEHNGQKVEKKMVAGFDYSIVAAHGDAIYYGSNWKRLIHKAELMPSGEIECRFVRTLLEGEVLHPGGLCSIVRENQTHIHRMCDDPNLDQSKVQVSEIPSGSVSNWCHLRNTAIFRETVVETIRPELRRLANNAVTLVCFRGKSRRFLETRYFIGDVMLHNSPWGSPAVVKSDYAYLTNGRSLFVIDPIEATMLPPLNFAGVSSFYICGIHNGILLGRGKCEKDGKYHVMTAKLPSKYVEKPRIISTEPIDKLEKLFASTFFKQFTVKTILGEGGFGCVFKVENNLDNWEYAVKRIAVRPFKKNEALGEARAMAQLDHPGIVGYKGTWTEEPPEGWQHERDAQLLKMIGSSKRNLAHANDSVFIYIQMQLCNHSLFDWLKESQNQSSRSLPRMKSWFKQMVSAVNYIHGKNLIHRDLKPSNVLFADSDTVKICDLGIATVRRDEEDSLRSALERTNVGTKLYMSPEQLNGKPYGSQTDVFTLGLILSEMCLVMTEDERNEIFHDYRLGKQCNRITDASTNEFIGMLTRVNQEERPSSKDMLNHLFIA